MAFCIGARRASAGPGDSVKQLSLQGFLYRKVGVVWDTPRRALSPVAMTIGLIHFEVIDASFSRSTEISTRFVEDFLTAARGACSGWLSQVESIITQLSAKMLDWLTLCE